MRGVLTVKGPLWESERDIYSLLDGVGGRGLGGAAKLGVSVSFNPITIGLTQNCMNVEWRRLIG